MIKINFTISVIIILFASIQLGCQTKETNKPIERDHSFHNMLDKNNGMVMARFPLPKNWDFNQDRNASVSIKGPNNLKVYKEHQEIYAYSNDPFMRQTMSMAGQNVSPLLSLEQIIDNLKSEAESQGYNFIAAYNLPDVQQMLNNQIKQMYQLPSTKREMYAMGVEWDGPGEKKTFSTFTQGVVKDQYNGSVLWILTRADLECEGDYFDKAKTEYISAMANTQYSMDWIAYNNQKTMQQIQQDQRLHGQWMQYSRNLHNQRMAAINARGNAAKSVGDIYSEISDIQHNGYLKRSNMIDAGHSKTIDATLEQSVIHSPVTNESYYVPSGNNYYWINPDGEYISSDNAFFDPRLDNRLNNQEWNLFEVQK